MNDNTLSITLEQTGDYEFRIRFDNTTIPDLATDESSPLGDDAGPDPSRLLLTSIANCLSASLLFALRKFKNQPGPLQAKATAKVERNDKGRLRIAATTVDIQLPESADQFQHLDRALAQFEDFCTVTESVRSGIPVAVRVLDQDGTIRHQTSTAS